MDWAKLTKTKKFENLVNKLIAPPPNMNKWLSKSPGSRGARPVNNYYDRRSVARNKAIRVIENRRRAGKPAFSLSPPKRVSPPKKAATPPKRVSPVLVKLKPPQRLKIKGPSGRMVYADTQPIKFLRKYADNKGINVSNVSTRTGVLMHIIYAA